MFRFELQLIDLDIEFNPRLFIHTDFQIYISLYIDIYVSFVFDSAIVVVY